MVCDCRILPLGRAIDCGKRDTPFGEKILDPHDSVMAFNGIDHLLVTVIANVFRSAMICYATLCGIRLADLNHILLTGKSDRSVAAK
uniref:Integrase n=1 Tax=Haemonchus contortus TaxID=6289 RepID=A0A7I4Y5A6_HAECO